jgi:hypothetical protein
MVTIRVEKLVVDPASLRIPSPNEVDLEDHASVDQGKRYLVDHYKRVKATLSIRWFGDAKRFDAILDMRAGLFRVRARADVTSAEFREVSGALLNEFGVYYSRPISQLFIPVENGEAGEWIVTDPDRVNGLLHRLSESKEFEGRPEPPVPPALAAIIDAITRAALANAYEMWKSWDEAENIIPVRTPVFHMAAWQANRDRFLDLCDNRNLREKAVELFEMVDTYDRLYTRYLDPPVHLRTNYRNEGPDTVLHLRQLRNDSHNKLREILLLLEDKAKLDKLDGTPRAAKSR